MSQLALMEDSRAPQERPAEEQGLRKAGREGGRWHPTGRRCRSHNRQLAPRVWTPGPSWPYPPQALLTQDSMWPLLGWASQSQPRVPLRSQGSERPGTCPSTVSDRALPPRFSTSALGLSADSPFSGHSAGAGSSHPPPHPPQASAPETVLPSALCERDTTRRVTGRPQAKHHCGGPGSLGPRGPRVH